MQPFEDFAHIGAGTLAGRFIRNFWQPVMISEDLGAGQPKRIQVLGEFFTAYRGEGGAPHIVQDACPHRQTRLSLGWVEGDCVRCFYHGWMFDGEGNCTEQPAEKDSFKDKVKIQGHPARDYLGFVFAYLGDGDTPEFPLFPEIDETKDTVTYNQHPVPCNYFQRVENDLDEVHIHFVHRVSADEAGLDQLPEIEVSEADYGILRTGKRSDDGNNVTRTAHIMMPNTLMTITPGSSADPDWTLHFAWRVPITDEEMASFIISTKKGGGGGLLRRPHTDPDPNDITEDVLQGRVRVQDLDPGYRGLFNVQDNVALAGQGRIVDRSKDWLGQSDKGIILLRQIWARELKALADGMPIKNWRRPKKSFMAEKTREIELANS
ncbi:MAG: Rieske 2Fe-2S domain-containing protein [Rhodospirillales bacterium]|nr:Rieske 2Fe-2S domain-containing protein [Rhodospirillales bacterium]